MSIENNLINAGLILPAVKVKGNYVPYQCCQNLVFIAGALSIDSDGEVITGHIVDDSDLPKARQATRFALMQSLAMIHQACSEDWQRFQQFYKLELWMQASPTFIHHSEVADSASDLVNHIFGESGQHTRVALGVASCPKGAMVEIAAQVEIRS